LHWQAKDLPHRQQTLRSAISWSYELLSREEQILFRHLGVFTGSFSLEAAEAIAEPLGVDALEGLASLVDKSLIQVQGRGRSTVRYVLLESMRDYALERLREAGEREEAARTHAFYYLELAEQAEPHLTRPEQQLWFSRLEGAHDTLGAALRWLLDHEEGERALRLATALGYFWEARGYITEGRRWLEEALMKAPAADPRLRARALSRLGCLLIWLADEVERPRAILTQALDLARSVQEPATIARSLTCLAMLDLFTRQWEQSHRYLEEALTYWAEAGDNWGIAYTTLYRGATELLQGHYAEATRLLEESLAQYREIDVVPAQGLALVWLVYAAGEQGNIPGAVPRGRELLKLSTETQDRRLLCLCGAEIAWLLREQGDAVQLTHLLGAIQQLQEMMGIDRGRILSGNEVVAIARDVLQTRLSQEGFEAALAEGRSLTFRQLAFLLGDVLNETAQVRSPEAAAQEKGQATLLSPREQDVLRLVAEGRSNKEIAKELIVAPSTVKTYVTFLFDKLGADTRAQAVALAAQRGLLQPSHANAPSQARSGSASLSGCGSVTQTGHTRAPASA
jgi:non-specific serine/threonine protein kinase